MSLFLLHFNQSAEIFPLNKAYFSIMVVRLVHLQLKHFQSYLLVHRNVLNKDLRLLIRNYFNKKEYPNDCLSL